jgi:hypothetical protein
MTDQWMLSRLRIKPSLRAGSRKTLLSVLVWGFALSCFGQVQPAPAHSVITNSTPNKGISKSNKSTSKKSTSNKSTSNNKANNKATTTVDAGANAANKVSVPESTSASNPGSNASSSTGSSTAPGEIGVVSAVSALSYTAKLIVQTAGSLDPSEPTSYSGWYSVGLGATHKPSKVSANLRLGYSREYSYQRDDGTDGAFDNPTGTIAKRYVNGEDFNSSLIDSVSIGLTGALPGNREAQKQTFRGSLGPSLMIGKAVGRLNLSQVLAYTRRFYEFDIRDDGAVNSPDALRATSSLSVDVNDKASFSVSVGLTYLRSFQGIARTTESSALAVDYVLSKAVSLSAGFATDRGTLETDGQTNTVKVFDPNRAQAFVELAFVL